MTKLEKLMEELCPNGVEYVKLNSICVIYDGTHQTPNYRDSGIPFISVENIGDIYNSTKYISLEDYNKYKIKPQINDVFMTRIGSIGKCAVFEKDMDLAYYVSLALIRPNPQIVNSRYLKHLIESTIGTKELRKRTLVNAVPIKINKDDIGKIKLPIPPLEVQAEIVKILDDYSTSVAALQQELEKELTARKKQYEYYRDKLLSFGVLGGGTSECEWRTLGEICTIVTGGEPPLDCIKGDTGDSTHKFPVWGNGKEVYGYSGTYKIDKDAVVISSIGANTGTVYYRKAFFTPIIRLKVVMPKDDQLNARFLFHALSATEIKSKSSSVPNMNASEIKALKIPFPPLSEQERIVKILDRFDKLCNDLSEGLPAEIEARQKQYEYYRDKLLTFKELKYE